MSRNFFKSTRKIIGAGVNYKEILRITNAAKPDNPVIFFKPISSLISTDDDTIKVPRVFGHINFEAELGVVIGKRCNNVSQDQAMQYVAGYCLALDMTGMDFIIDARPKGLPWCLGKGFDTSTPVSRLISAEELGDPANVRVWCKVNEQMKQDDSTKNLIFSIPELIAFTSKFMTLEENDLILTGTPAGAGPVKDGDVLECGLGDFIQMKFNVKNE
ncbi:acylpyruvase FAHD1, mitochondrial isoform X1 [Uranotaenia lowii]|uniref:acylpyruvase FAHD1, mitochondrial isoform X1 n=2 Tax=Uranotaenia lowii TaxID=190385 RepID=UPI0024796A63|nr:acylpyruvase FAHD1, mitochondrial isoform X1 [Uranotaenia lowii]XP_055605394.1 acylpyruvase FAHD1, mitochondrial isoform X1 [Uranotaenia lowii]